MTPTPALYKGIGLPGHPDPENIRKLDLLPLPMIRRMQRVGVMIDKEWLCQLTERLESTKQRLRAEIGEYIPQSALEEFVGSTSEMGMEINVDSAEQIGSVLFKTLRLGAGSGASHGQGLKLTKSGKRLSTGKKQLEQLKHRHPIVPLILEYREASKLVNTYTVAMPQLAIRHTGSTLARPVCAVDGCGRRHWEDHYRIHAEFPTTRTDTGRLASRRPNLQNIPAKSALGREVRKGFVASVGMRLVSVDFSQIELRLLAHAAQESAMCAVFHRGGDIHTATAMAAFDLPLESMVDKLLHRAPCKNVNFGIVYSLSAPGLYDLMVLTYAIAGMAVPDWLTVEWCEQFIDKWFGIYPGVRDLMDLYAYRTKRYGIAWTEAGRVRRVPEMQSVHRRIRAAGLRQAGNMPIQGLAADLFRLAMAMVEDRLEVWRQAGVEAEAMLPVHDELVIEADERWAEEIEGEVARVMSNVMRVGGAGDGEELCRVPVLAEGKVMTRWEK